MRLPDGPLEVLGRSRARISLPGIPTKMRRFQMIVFWPDHFGSFFGRESHTHADAPPRVTAGSQNPGTSRI
jgi:hypothetical protein